MRTPPRLQQVARAISSRRRCPQAMVVNTSSSIAVLSTVTFRSSVLTSSMTQWRGKLLKSTHRACSFDSLELLFDWYSNETAPLGPGAIVVADLGITQQVVQHKPGMAAAFSNATIGDDLFVSGDTLAF